MKKLGIFILAAIALMGCKNGEGFLDHEPDMRAHIDTKEKVRLLLVSAYTRGNNAAILECSSDNIVDNNAPDAVGHCKKLLPLDKMYDEMFAWKQVVSGDQQDSPKYLWDSHYMAISAANEALLAIAQLEEQGINMNAEKGEALLIRAYHHFLLSMVFCHAYKTPELSKNDLGIVYMTKPETTVRPQYTRPSLTETYEKIQADLEEGLKYVSNEYYSVPKYHFNVQAAHAFAARFYLYTRQWDKVIEHANLVLSTDPKETQSRLLDYRNERLATDPDANLKVWIDPQSPSNLLLYTTMSQVPYTLFESYGRYQPNNEALDYSLTGAGPCWRNRYLTSAFHLWSGGGDGLGVGLGKFLYLFEYIDKVNGYGYIHAVTRAFTSEETLMCRAEAKVHLNDINGAIEDLKIWCNNLNVEKNVMDINADSTVNLTYNKIKDFYINKHKGTPYAPELHNEDMVPGWTISPAQLPVIYACLHFRRIETFHDGLRFQDLKRYGIEITHKQGLNPEDKLVWNDERRALQLPQEVILSGMEANPRPEVKLPSGSYSIVTK